MNRFLLIYLLIIAGLSGCKNLEKTNHNIEITEKYFKALNDSNGSNSSEIIELLSDSLVTSIPEYDYEVRYSKKDYVEKWLKWDSVFKPTYKILKIEIVDGLVKAKVSKTDKRIDFFMQKPFLTNEILRFKDNKLISVETEYLNFDYATWEKNKTELLNWTEENHPELNILRFINIQTESGGIKLLQAIELFEDK